MTIEKKIKKQVNAKKLKKNNLFTCRPAVMNGQNVVVINFDEDCRIIYADKSKNEVIITGIEVIDDDSPVKEKTLEEKTKEEQIKKAISDLKRAKRTNENLRTGNPEKTTKNRTIYEDDDDLTP